MYRLFEFTPDFMRVRAAEFINQLITNLALRDF